MGFFLFVKSLIIVCSTYTNLLICLSSLLDKVFSTQNIRISEVTTVEGVLERVYSGLSQEQGRRREIDPESAAKIDDFLVKLMKCKTLSEKWTLVYFVIFCAVLRIIFSRLSGT